MSTSDDLALLRAKLQTALSIEHATVPPYLTAWASAENASAANVVPRRILRTVFTEEMLHMVQVANLLLAVGGTPRLTSPGFVPSYPHALPGAAPGWVVSIGPLSPAAIADFQRIEQPRAHGAPPEDEGWHTIGQFYATLRELYQRVVSEQPDLLAANASRQIPPEAFYGSASLRTITTLDDVNGAFDEIMTQGEGNDGSVFDDDPAIFGGGGREPAHYYRFVEIAEGRQYQPGDTPSSGPTGERFQVSYTAVSPMRTNATLEDYAAQPEVLAVLREFNRLYGRLLQTFETAFSGSQAAFVQATAQMFAVGRMAASIGRMPDPTSPGNTVGLVFAPVFVT